MMSLALYLQSATCPEEAKTTISALASAAEKIAEHARLSGLAGYQMGHLTGQNNNDGDNQKQLDVLADELIFSHLNTLPLHSYFSEERNDAQLISSEARLSVACDPLDGSSNIDTNLTVGTIFSIFHHSGPTGPVSGRAQVAAGFFAYGPQTSLILSCGGGTYGFALTHSGWQGYAENPLSIPKRHPEFAINTSNQAFWPDHVSRYISGLLMPSSKPRVNMRWLGSLVADAFRIFRRGGIFLYPQDSRTGYEQGRLRLVYEASPIAFIVEQAGGKATNGDTDILDIKTSSIHQRVPLIFGSRDEVDAFLKVGTIS